MSTIICALQRRETESGGMKEEANTLCDGAPLLQEVYESSSNGNPQQPISRNDTRDVSRARDHQESSPWKPDRVQSFAPHDEQRVPELQEPKIKSNTSSHLTHIDAVGLIFSVIVKPSGGLQSGQVKDCQQSLTSSGSPEEELPVKTPRAPKYSRTRQQKGIGAGGSQTRHLPIPQLAQTRSDSLTGSTLRSFTTESLRSFRRRKPQPWPNPEKSLGEMIKPNKKIKRKVWVAEGPALKLFEEQIRPQIEQLLHNTEPPQCGPLLLELYMIGKGESSASPIIMICCCDRKVRREAESAIRESDILQDFPQIGLGNSDTPLEANGYVAPVTGGDSEGHMDSQVISSFVIHSSKDILVGRRLQLVEKTEGRETVRFATGGPFVRIGKHVYQLTAFHIGQGYPGSGPPQRLGLDQDNCEFDGQSDTEDDESDLEQDTGKDTPNKESNSSLRAGSTSLSMTYAEEHDLQDAWSPRIVPNRSDIDYYLVELTAGEASKASNAIEKFEGHSSLQITDIGALPASRTQVVVVTSYSLLTGTIMPGKKRAKMYGLNGFQDLITARLSCSIKPGDSGSAVIDALTGCLYGHVILGTAPDTIVYIVPSVNVFTNVLSTFGKLPDLNSTWSDPRAIAQSGENKSTQTSEQESGIQKTIRSAGADSGYEVHPSSDFEPGKVFQVTWSEPFVSNARFDNTSSEEPLGQAPKLLRRFMVVENGDGHSICASIRTYGKLGCAKHGVKPQYHGIVYDEGSQPALLSGEPELGIPPICFEPSLQVRTGKEARADYRDLAVVQHTVEVMFIGRIATKDWPTVQAAVDGCQNRERAQGSSRRDHQTVVEHSDKNSFIGANRAATRDHGSTFRSSDSIDRNMSASTAVHWPYDESINDEDLRGQKWTNENRLVHRGESVVKDSKVQDSLRPGMTQVDRGTARTRDPNEVIWDFENPGYDDELKRHFWEGRRVRDGRTFRKYQPGKMVALGNALVDMEKMQSGLIHGEKGGGPPYSKALDLFDPPMGDIKPPAVLPDELGGSPMWEFRQKCDEESPRHY